MEYNITDLILDYIDKPLRKSFQIKDTNSNMYIYSRFNLFNQDIMMINVEFTDDPELLKYSFILEDHIDEYNFREYIIPPLKDIVFVIDNMDVDFCIKIYQEDDTKNALYDDIKYSAIEFKNCVLNDRAHIGNARSAVVFDVLFRILRKVYGEIHVSYARNFTDVDDKINAAAINMSEFDVNVSREIITKNSINWYHEDMNALNVLTPTHEPKATEYIKEMLATIKTLVDNDYAYVANGEVKFKISSDNNYGLLSGRNDNKEDFILWKPSLNGEPFWQSEYGNGRPGWHIECSAMSNKLFGSKFDIHGGGLDLLFPHHENEIAQSTSYNKCIDCDDSPQANYWLHNEMVMVENKKMSKSLNNFFTVNDVIKMGYSGQLIRMVLLSNHYRKVVNWNKEKIDATKKTLDKWNVAIDNVVAEDLPEDFFLMLYNDMDILGVIAKMHTYYKNSHGLLKSAMLFLGLI